MPSTNYMTINVTVVTAIISASKRTRTLRSERFFCLGGLLHSATTLRIWFVI